MELDISIAGRRGSLDDEAVAAWVVDMARMTDEYVGRFPVRTLRVDVELRPGDDVIFGQHFSGRRVRVLVGRDASEATLREDHILLHELLHTAFPMLDERHQWMREGLSTYLEMVVRARGGRRTEQQVWRRWTRAMPVGLPEADDNGLDASSSWARTYWGGALFWFMVDLRLRKASRGRHSIRTLLQGVVAHGGVATSRWTMDELLSKAESITSTEVLGDAYGRYALRSSPDDLERIFRYLGVYRIDDAVQFSEDAPGVSLRRALLR
ncbi:MAG: hypothetical protein AAGF12_23205 [Myxococcota bacterium]